MEGGLESSSARVEELGGVFSIWRFLNILMKISAALRCYRFVGYFHSGLDIFNVAFCLNKQAHMVNDGWPRSRLFAEEVSKCCFL